MASFFPVSTSMGDIEAFDNRLEKNRTRRLANVEAMRKLGEMASADGRQLGMDEWAEQAKNILGADDFLNSTAPSQQVLDSLLADQNKRAAIKAEEQRRAQFKVDAEEESSIEADISKQALEGKSEGEITQFGIQKYGDRFNKVVPRVQGMIKRATLSASQRAYETLGSQFQTVEDANSFIGQQGTDVLSKPEIEGILRRARDNESRLESAVVMAGDKAGASLGLDANNETAVREYIDLAIPREVTGAVREQMLRKGVEAARRSATMAATAKQSQISFDAQRADAMSQPQRIQQIITMGERDAALAEQRAAQLAQQYAGPVAAQQATVDAINKKKKPTDEEAKLVPLLQNYVFANPGEVQAAIEMGDAGKPMLARLIAAAVPINEHMSRAKGLSNIVKGVVRYDSIDKAYSDVAKIAVAGADLSKDGKTMIEMQKQADKPMGRLGSEVRTAAERAAKDIKADFINEAAQQVVSIRNVIRSNGSIAADRTAVETQEMALVRRFVSEFVSGTELKGEAAITMTNDLMVSILNKMSNIEGTGPIERRLMPHEQYAAQTGQLSRNLGNNPAFGYLPNPAPGQTTSGPPVGGGVVGRSPTSPGELPSNQQRGSW